MADSLTLTTPTDRDVVITRAFNAPRGHVWAALTTPSLLTQWYGPAGWRLVICEIDLRVGGAWHFVVQRPDGKRIGQRGVYQELDPPARIVTTETWDDWDAGETLVTTVLVEKHDGTTFTSTVHFPSREVRDQVLKSGLETAAGQEYARLEELLAAMPS